tara:strand:- start:767 stop:946 length:180 start_codon:yes stop_codon:yes gene_type:complete
LTKKLIQKKYLEIYKVEEKDYKPRGKKRKVMITERRYICMRVSIVVRYREVSICVCRRI